MKEKHWFELDVSKIEATIPKKSHLDRIAQAYDIKYGNYDYSQDIRSLCTRDFKHVFGGIIKDTVHKYNCPKILVCGANSGYEVEFVKEFDVTALDLSRTALEKLKYKYPKSKVKFGDINELSFTESSFEIYVCMRTLCSDCVDLERSLIESMRVVTSTGTLIYSIPNGYAVDGVPVKGMYNINLKEFDQRLPYDLLRFIFEFFSNLGIKVEVIETLSEIIVIVNLSNK